MYISNHKRLTTIAVIILSTAYIIGQSAFQELNKKAVTVDDLEAFDRASRTTISKHVKNVGILNDFMFYKYKEGSFPDCCDAPVAPIYLSGNKGRWTLVVFATIGGPLGRNNKPFSLSGRFATYLSSLNKTLPNTDIWLVAVNEFSGMHGKVYTGGFLEKCDNCYDKFLMVHPNRSSGTERDYKRFRSWYMSDLLARQYGPFKKASAYSIYLKREIMNPFCKDELPTGARQVQRESLIYPGFALLNPKSELVTYWNGDIAKLNINDATKLVSNVKSGSYTIAKSSYRFKKPRPSSKNGSVDLMKNLWGNALDYLKRSNVSGDME